MRGIRGLPGGSSLPRLLAARRGVRNRKSLPPLTVERILAWADAHRVRTGRWPRYQSGPIPEAPGETWNAVDSALRAGIRGLPGNSSLAQLLVEWRGVRHAHHPPSFDRPRDPGLGRRLPREHRALANARLRPHRRGTRRDLDGGQLGAVQGDSGTSGRIVVGPAPGPGARGRNHMDLPPLSVPEILRWAEAHRERHGTWPTLRSGPIPEAPGESWINVQAALDQGTRGLPGGSSLARLLAAARSARNRADLPPLTVERILA